jgi:SAM-dependent methyltransferase
MKAEAAQLARALARKSPWLTALSFRARGIRPLHGLAELDAFLDECMQGSVEVTSGALERMAKAYLRPPREIRIPADPRSGDYRKAQEDLYAWIAGRAYATENEATAFDAEATRNDFFPYNTRSGPFVGSQLQSHGFAIRNIDLPPGASIVEFGPGWGNLTLHLALMGYRMTAVEINAPSIALMAHRAAIHGRTIEFARCDMSEFAATTDRKFDAALFLASFHHSHDHRKLAADLGRILAQRAKIYFADEPIAPAGNPSLPYPWGLRLDAPSLYYVRRHGWLELGFRAAYFRDLFEGLGWRCRTVPSPVRGVADLFVAERG